MKKAGSWRPFNWEEIVDARIKKVNDFPIIHIGIRDNFEAGADAILKALRDSGIQMGNYHPVNRTVIETAAFLNQCEDGILVFLPEESK